MGADVDNTGYWEQLLLTQARLNVALARLETVPPVEAAIEPETWARLQDAAQAVQSAFCAGDSKRLAGTIKTLVALTTLPLTCDLDRARAQEAERQSQRRAIEQEQNRLRELAEQRQAERVASILQAAEKAWKQAILTYSAKSL